VGGRLGGHYVLGHVDGRRTADIKSGKRRRFRNVFQFSRRTRSVSGFLKLDSDQWHQPYHCLSGKSHILRAVIPHTWASTNLRELVPEIRSNLEADILGKYFERFFQLGLAPQEKGVSRSLSEYMKSQGY